VTDASKAVFLSYASEDAEAARRIAGTLQAAGIEVWLDQSQLRGGDAWDRQIRDRIHQCRLFIAVISAHTEDRDEGYFRHEWNLAVERTHHMAEKRAFIVPVAIDNTPERGASVPEKFHDVQWARLPDGETLPAFVARIADLLGTSVAHSTPPPVHIADQPRTLPRRALTASGRAKWLWLSIATMAILIAGGWAAWRYGGVHEFPATTSLEKTQANAPEKSIAVLPFVDLSEKKDQEYFADGIAEEILNLLVKVPGLLVIGRTSSFQFKSKAEDLRQIGVKLGAAFVVEGSVRRTGDRLRVTSQLIDAQRGAHIWSETYDREAHDILELESDIAVGIAGSLSGGIAMAQELRSRGIPVNGEAYDLFLRGMYAGNRIERNGFEEAAADFQRALEIDPSFAPAAEGLAEVWRDLGQWDIVPPHTAYENARTAAQLAIRLDPKSSHAHRTLSIVHNEYDWDWAGADRELKLARDLAPSDPANILVAAILARTLGRFNEADRLARSYVAAEPLSAGSYNACGYVYLDLGRWVNAEQCFRRMLQITPTFQSGHLLLGIAILLQGRFEPALAEFQLESVEGGQRQGLALAYSALERKRDADTALAQFETDQGRDWAFEIAEVYAYRAQNNEAFKWLERAYDQKDVSLYGIKASPLLSNLRGDPRYKAFLRKMKLPE
jgi:TolB-like protein/Flp pilus assembly protein TadD